MRVHRNIILAILSGLLLALSFPKFGNGMVAWIALIPLFFALEGVACKGAGFRLGFLTGLVAYAGILYWVVYVVVHYGYLPFYVGIAALLLLCCYLSLYTGLFAAGVIHLEHRGVPKYLSAPLIWTLLEYLRSFFLTGFPWESLAYSQYRFTSLIQISDLTGIYGLTFLIVMVNAVLFDLLRFRSGKRPVFKEAAVALAAVLLVVGYGHFRISQISGKLKNAREFGVALVQGNIDQSVKWNPQYQSRTIDIYRSLSMVPFLPEGTLIVWPETAVPFYFQRPEPLQEAVVDVARKTKSPMLFGSPSYRDEGGDISYLNSAYLVKPDGQVAGRYDKVHLVPYGEYVPLRKWFPFIGKLVVGVGDFGQGKGFYPLSGDSLRLGVLICYEGIFPEAARDYKNRGAELLVNITNDAWFGKTSAPYQHLSMTAFRAVESRLYLVRAANTGISAVINPLGEILSQTGIFERTVLAGQIKSIDEKSYYAAYGDVFVYFCVVLLLAAYIFTGKRRSNHVGRHP
ncbi:MAG: apolipoprotein N-acyltransferase [Deltaproteobacteria bacterium]|nr:apolipoprotein N-acyltransferase [Deltaproteobacteria bacterium]